MESASIEPSNTSRRPGSRMQLFSLLFQMELHLFRPLFRIKLQLFRVSDDKEWEPQSTAPCSQALVKRREAPEGIPEKHSAAAKRRGRFEGNPPGPLGGSRASLRSPRPGRCRRTRGASPSPPGSADAGWSRCRRRRWRQRQREHASPRTRRSQSPTRLPSRRRGRSS